MTCLRLVSLLSTGLLLICAGCIGPHYSKHLIVLASQKPPEIKGPNDPAIEENLSTNPWPRSFLGPVVGVGVVLFKSMGIAGWKDFHLYARARGVEVQHQISSSGFLTVDLLLKSLTVEDVSIPINGPKYMRVEIYLGRVTVASPIRHQTNQVITAEGKLAWDSDGWFEIHPQKTGDVLPEQTKGPAGP